MKKKPIVTTQAPSFADFANAASTRVCEVCALVPRAVRDEIISVIRSRNTARFNLTVATKWLAEAHGIMVTEEEMLRHFRGRHDGN